MEDEKAGFMFALNQISLWTVLHLCWESIHWTLEWVICNFFGFSYYFRQGFMRVTLRNKKNIGLICFMLVSSSDFGLLCCTITHYNYKGKMAKISPKIHKIEIWPKSRPKVINSRNKSNRDHIWGCLNYKSGLRILIWPLEVPFFVVRKQSLLPKVPIFETKKMALRVAKSKF